MADPSFTLDRPYDRAELAALFGEFAAALEDDRPATIDVDGATAEVAFPPQVSVGLVGVREDEPPTEGLELHLEWDGDDEERVRLEPVADDPPEGTTDDVALEGESEGGAEADDADEPTPEAASSVMPPDAYSPGEDPTPPSPDEADSDAGDAGRTSRFEVYRDRAGEWRWRLVHWNGNVIADSGEGYASRFNAVRAARGVMRATADARIEHLD